MRLLPLVLLLGIPLAAESLPFETARPGYRYNFPRDHFDHRAFRTEWWYYTGNVASTSGKRFGFELVFFRQAQKRGGVRAGSTWRAGDLFLAHLALTEIEAGRFRSLKRLNRAGPGLAGIDAAAGRIWNGNWSAVWKGEQQTLQAVAPEFGFTLRLRPAKPLVIHGENGVSQKAPGEGRASHYVSFPRLEVEGEIAASGERHPVRGNAWMDHEWFTHQLEDNQVGWDWFSLQLENKTELMLFQLRRKDGTIDPFSAGTYIDASGKARHLKSTDFELKPVQFWTSPKTRAKYPVRWRLRIPSAGLELESRAAIDSQELVETGTAGAEAAPSYWEGAVIFSGTVPGRGYLEMTGYDKPVKLN